MTLPLCPLLRANLPSAPLKLHVSHAMDAFRKALPIPHHTLHDYRRYLSSSISSKRICAIDICESILAHTAGSRSPIQRVYDRDSRLPQMRDALLKFEAHLQRVLEPDRT